MVWKISNWPSAVNWCWFEEWVVEMTLGLFLSEPLVIPEFRFKRHSSIFIPSILSWSDAEFFILFMKSCKVVEWLEIHMSSKRLRLVMNILDTLGYESWSIHAMVAESMIEANNPKTTYMLCSIVYILLEKTHWCCIYLYIISADEYNDVWMRHTFNLSSRMKLVIELLPWGCWTPPISNVFAVHCIFIVSKLSDRISLLTYPTR